MSVADVLLRRQSSPDGLDAEVMDCGLFQGLKELRLRNWAPQPFDPTSLDAVVLSHAHLDHSGGLLLLQQLGWPSHVARDGECVGLSAAAIAAQAEETNDAHP